MGLKWNGTAYWYVKNLQGDIIGILDSDGTEVVNYVYDAWGQVSLGGTPWNWVALGELNPFRYRGYYYDTESGLYYLNSRYYDPEISRFLNADAILIGMAFRGLNLFIVTTIQLIVMILQEIILAIIIKRDIMQKERLLYTK